MYFLVHRGYDASMVEQVPSELLELLLKEPLADAGPDVEDWVMKVAEKISPLDITQMILNLDRQIAEEKVDDLPAIYRQRTMLISRRRLRDALKLSTQRTEDDGREPSC